MNQKGFSILFIFICLGVAILIAGSILIFILNSKYKILGETCTQIDDTLPMYGGVRKCWIQKLNDEVFIINATNAKPWLDSSRLRASRKLLLESETHFREKEEYAQAIKILNKAWILSPNDPLIYSDFGAVLAGQGNFGESFKMYEQGLQIKTATPGEQAGVMCNFGLSYIQRLSFDKLKEDSEKGKEYIAKADQLLDKAVKLSPNNGYCHGVWALVLLAQHKYPETWREVNRAKQLGYDVPKQLIDELSSKMPDPE